MNLKIGDVFNNHGTFWLKLVKSNNTVYVFDVYKNKNSMKAGKPYIDNMPYVKTDVIRRINNGSWKPLHLIPNWKQRLGGNNVSKTLH